MLIFSLDAFVLSDPGPTLEPSRHLTGGTSTETESCPSFMEQEFFQAIEELN